MKKILVRMTVPALALFVIAGFQNCAPAPHSSSPQLQTNSARMDQYLADSGTELMGDMTIPQETTNSFGDKDSSFEKATGFVHYGSSKWPNAQLVYKFDSNVLPAWRKSFAKACQEWAQGSVLTCREATPSDSYSLRVMADDKLGGFCFLGFTPRTDRLVFNLPSSRWTQYDIILHEVGHALGLIHEQQRPDRDDYIYVDTSNIQPNFAHAYAKVSTRDLVYGTYDFESIMHYPAAAYSKNGKAVMTSRPGYPNVPTRNPSRLSSKDRLAMQEIYGAKGTSGENSPPVLAEEKPKSTTNSNVPVSTTETNDTTTTTGVYSRFARSSLSGGPTLTLNPTPNPTPKTDQGDNQAQSQTQANVQQSTPTADSKNNSLLLGQPRLTLQPITTFNGIGQ